jgi:hypothetical protein
MPTSAVAQVTVLDALIASLMKTCEHNSNAKVGPAAILWPDGTRQWNDVIPRLREHFPILTLGDYDADSLTGPAIWIRAELARRSGDDEMPIVYLPGYSKEVLRHVEEAPNTIEPLVYLQYCGTMFLQPNGKDWTIAAFLQNAQHGLGLSVDRDEDTRSGLVRAASKLFEQTVDELKAYPGGIDREFLDRIMIPDLHRSVLQWIDEPESFRDTLGESEWAAFTNQLRHTYHVDPDKDGPTAAARKLGEGKVGSHWDHVWNRYAESPGRYKNIPNLLRGARPADHGQKTLFDDVEVNYHWPQDNEEAENELRSELAALASLSPTDARSRLLELEGKHATRRSSVWAELGEAPLAFTLEHLANLASRTAEPFPAGDVEVMQRAYEESGWQIDTAALDATVEVSSAQDRSAVDAALHAAYTPWLWQTAKDFQEAIATTEGPDDISGPAVQSGTGVLFADGLRYDLAARLSNLLTGRGLAADLRASIGPLPGVTPSAKPAQSPVASRLTAGQGLDTRVASTGTGLNQTSFKKLIIEEGWQFFSREGVGRPASDQYAWTELGDIDSYGHSHPDDLPRQAKREIERLGQRITELLDAGWERVVVVTDHGWLLTPRPMEKTELPQHLTAVRKGRCARLEDGASTALQTVPWHWDESVRVAVAPGISCFEEGKRYDHGGISLQECVVPTITVSASGGSRPTAAVTIVDVAWINLRCSVEVAGGEGFTVDIRERAGDPESSIVASVKPVEDGGARVLVDDGEFEGRDAILVVLDAKSRPVAQRTVVVGGEQ